MNKKLKLLDILTFSLLFASCSTQISDGDFSSARFAKGSELAVLEINAKDDCGTTEPNGEVSLKIGNTYNISFSENKGYQFEKWEVINKETGKTYNDVISFADKNEPDTTIKILKNEENILIQAVSQKRPAYISNLPEFKDEGVFCDSVIVVEFDSPISEDSFYYTEEDLKFLTYDSLLTDEKGKIYGYIFNKEIFYKNLFISSSTDENLLEYFNPPVIEGGTILRILPKNNQPLVTSTNELLDIDVLITPDVFTENGIYLGGEGVHWRYRVNSKTDENSPEFSNFELFFNKNKLVAGEEFTPKNHVSNIIEYNYSGIDEESGVNFARMEVKRLQTPEGIQVEEEPIVKILQTGESGTGSVEIESEDGLLCLTFILTDYSGNESLENPQFIVAKDTTVRSDEILFYNNNSIKDGDVLSFEELESSINTIYWENSNKDVWTKNNFTSADNLSYELLWGTKKDNFVHHIECSKSLNYRNGKWSYNFSDFSKEQITYLRLQVKDEVGNVSFVNTIIPEGPSDFIYNEIAQSDNGLKTFRIFYTIPKIFEENLSSSYKGYLYYSEDGKNYKTKILSKNYADIEVKDITNCKFYFQIAYLKENSCFLSKLVDFSFVEDKSLLEPVVKEVKVQKGKTNSGKNIAFIDYTTVPAPGISYNIFWGTSLDSIVHYEKSNRIEFDADAKSIFYKTVSINTKTGSSKSGEIHEYDVSFQTFDTIPPKIENLQCVINYQKTDEYVANGYSPIITCEVCYDNFKTINSKAEYILYTVPVQSDNISFDEIPLETIKNSPFITGFFEPPESKTDKSFIWSKVEGLKFIENYFYVIYLKDSDGNYAYYPIKCSKQLLENVPKISVFQNKENSELVDIKFEIEKERRCKNYEVEYSIFDSNSKEFILRSSIDEQKSENNQYLQTEDGICSTVITDKKDTFYFGFAKAVYQYRGNETYKYTFPIYLYTGLDSSFCELKDFVDDRTGAQIYCDRPCLVMTYWSSVNYGYSIESWETYGVQSDIMYISAKNQITDEYEDTFKYYEVNQNSIPFGKYYVIVVHFADGTSVMSKTINTK